MNRLSWTHDAETLLFGSTVNSANLRSEQYNWSKEINDKIIPVCIDCMGKIINSFDLFNDCMWKNDIKHHLAKLKWRCNYIYHV